MPQGFHHGLRSSLHSSPGMIRSMNSLNIGTVKAVSPWLGLQIIPLLIIWLRVGASEPHPPVQCVRYVAGTVRPGSQLRHRPDVSFF